MKINALSLLWLMTTSISLTVAGPSLAATNEDRVVVVIQDGTGTSVDLRDKVFQAGTKGAIRSFLSSIGLNTPVEVVAAPNFDKIPKMVTEVLAGRKLKALVFEGHGNHEVYALGKENYVDGKDLAKILGPLLKTDMIESDLTLYFSGCSMAGEIANQVSFQESLYSNLTDDLEVSRRLPDLSIVAHSYPVVSFFGSGTSVGLTKANWIDRFSIRTGWSRFSLKMTSLAAPYLGSYGLPVSSIAFMIGSSHLAELMFPSYGQRIVAPLSMLVVVGTVRAASSMGKIGRSLGRNSRIGFVYDLMKNKFSSRVARCTDALSISAEDSASEPGTDSTQNSNGE